MPKLIGIALFLLSIPACDPPADPPAEDIESRAASVVVADVEAVDYGRKVLDACFVGSDATQLLLVVQDPVGDQQEFAFTLTAQAPVDEVACAWSIVTGWSQP